MPNLDDRLQSLLISTRHVRQRVARLIALPDFSEETSSELRNLVREEGSLSKGYVLMCGLSAGIATLGLLQSSVAVVIGAMLVSPLMSPIAALGFAFASLDGHRIRDAIRVVLVGAAIGIVTGMVLTWLSPIRNATSEIIGRTQPTLLDLAIALLSGTAGGYATVRQKGGTAIGVAIATALMPPLATVGYSIGVANWEFAGGALLLFLTNLAAIAFSFAIIARLSGVARPLAHVELTPGYIAAGMVAFLALATPLGLTLVRVSKEARARGAARSVLSSELHVSSGKIAQLDVKWPLLKDLTIDAVVIAPAYLQNAQQQVENRLHDMFGVTPHVSLQQIVASDNGSETRAMIEAALDRTTAGLARDVPPYDDIRSKIGLPIQSLWVDRGARVVNVAPADAPSWTLNDYRAVELLANRGVGEWKIRVIPPTSRRLTIAFPSLTAIPDSATIRALEVASWALSRWGVDAVSVVGTIKKNDKATKALSEQRIAQTAIALTRNKIRSAPQFVVGTDRENEILLDPFAPNAAAVEARLRADSSTRK